MNFLKRAVLSITRQKGTSIILLIIIFILGNVIAGSVAIQQATQNVETNIKTRLGAAAVITEDYELLNTVNWRDEDGNNIPKDHVTPEIIENIGALPQVSRYDYNVFLYLELTGYLTYFEEEWKNFGRNNYNEFAIKGVNYKEILDFVEGKTKLIDGRTFSNNEIADGSYVGLISREVAEQNNLRVGDTMSLKNTIYDYGGEMKGSEFANPEILASQNMIEIIGIHEPVLDDLSWSAEETDGYDHNVWEREERQNTIYIPVKTVVTEITFRNEQYSKMYPDKDKYKSNYDYHPIYLLNSPEDVESFRKDAQSFLPEYYLIYTSSDQYDQIAGAIVSMQSLSVVILYIAVFATILILTLLIILFLRDRKHEFGIYISLGEKRKNLIFQVVLEVVSVAFIAISASLVSGNFVARGVSDMLITNQLSQSQDQSSYYYNLFEYSDYGSNISKPEIIATYDIGFDFIYIALIYVIGLGTIIIAAVGPMIYILRLNPKKILLQYI
jgi:Predicted ABC-type transport system involved in lysophospholipase L1 biosynthesis, permease component